MLSSMVECIFVCTEGSFVISCRALHRVISEVSVGVSVSPVVIGCRASVTLSIDVVLLIPFSSNVLVSGVAAMILNGPPVFGSNFDSGALSRRADSDINTGGQSTNNIRLGWNCGALRAFLSKLHSWRALQS